MNKLNYSMLDINSLVEENRFLFEENRKKDTLIAELTNKLSAAMGLNNEYVRQVTEYSQQIAELKHTVKILQKALFGSKSEKHIDIPDLPDLPGLDLPEVTPEDDDEKLIDVPSHKRKKSPVTKDAFKLTLSDDLPTKEIVIDIPEEEKIDPETGEKLIVIGEDVSKKLAYTPGSYIIKIIKRPKYGKKNDPLFKIKQAPAPISIIEGSKFDPSFLAHIVVEKYGYHMPLNRQIEKLALHGIKISSQQMSSLILTLGERVQPIIDIMEQEMFSHGVLFTDDTPVKMMQNKNEKKKKCKKTYMWIYFSGKPNAPPYSIYKFSTGRSHKIPKEHLKNFTGFIHADCFQAYEELHKSQDINISWAACWVHARRKFIEAEAYNIEEGRNILSMIKNLFRYERVAWNSDSNERMSIRHQKELPIVDKLFAYMKKLVKNNRFTPKMKISTAIGYMLSREENFRLYLSNPDLRMDNNPAERSLRKVVVGRNNWLFVGSNKGGLAAANLLSLVQTCRAMNINPQLYLEDLFTNLMDYPANKIKDFLPDQWVKVRKPILDTE